MAAFGADDPLVGSVLAERYRIDALIGEGGMGKVYAAEHVLMKKRLAVKVLHRELTTVPEVVARFEREAMAAANIEHPNVAAATDFGKLADGSVYLVLEFVQGKNLRDEIAEGPLPMERALNVARQIAAGLGSAHAQGIVHRDLKPENVMLVEKSAEKDFVKVLDFGIAKVPIGEVPNAAAHKDQPITKAGMVFGTPEYMSPEQALGQAVDGRADLYSLGVILFEMLAGVRPFSSQSPVGILGQQLANPPPAFAARAPGVRVPPAVEQIVHRLLARERDQRFGSAAELVATLDGLLAPAPGRRGHRLTLSDGSPASGAARARGSLASRPGTEPEKPELPLPQFPLSDPNAAAPFDAAAPLAARAEDKPSFGEALARARDFLRSLPRAFRRGELRTTLTAAVLGAAARLRLALASIGPRAEGLRAKLPTRIRDSLRPVPTRALVLAGGVSTFVVALLVIAVVVALVRAVSPSDIETPPETAASASAALPLPPPPPTVASPAEIEAAASKDPSAFDALGAKYPTDPRPFVEAARAWAAAKDYPKATAAVGRALAADPESRGDERIAAVLFRTAQARASSDATFALLTGPMGARGAEILWDLAAEAAVNAAVRERAANWIRSPAFRRIAPESLSIAADLRTAKSCQAARALLPKAKAVADDRSFPQLEAWRKTDGCGGGKRDCMPCLRTDGLLEETIAAIRARRKAPSRSP